MDGFIVWLLTASSFWIFGESLNCAYPYHDGETGNAGMICQWEQETFYYSEELDRWILKEEDINDNWIEAKSRERYWNNIENHLFRLEE